MNATHSLPHSQTTELAIWPPSWALLLPLLLLLSTSAPCGSCILAPLGAHLLLVVRLGCLSKSVNWGQFVPLGWRAF